MADSKKKAPKERSAQTQDEPAHDLTLAAHPILSRAIEEFVRENANFESSLAINGAIDELNQSFDLQTVFATPLSHKLFPMDAALRWVLFLTLAPGRAVQEGDTEFSAEVPRFLPEDALNLLAGVYDVGVQEAVWNHFDAALDDEGDDEEDEEDEEDES